MDRRPFGPVPEVVLVVVLTAVVFAVWDPGRTAAADGTASNRSAVVGGTGDAGALLYGRDCAGCHGPDGEGSSRGIALTGSGEAAAHYMLVTGRMPIDEPDQEIRRSTPRYTDDEIDALVDHVAGLGDGPALPDVDPDMGDVPRGGQLYRLHCGMCHSATGIGGALAFDQFAPALDQSEPSVVVAAITAGPGAMPSFAPLGFTEQERASIVAYVQSMQEPLDEGGWPIFRAGRADEAMVLWLAAVPAFLLIAAWTARRVR